MSFRGLLRPGQGFKEIIVLRRTPGVTEKGRPTTGELRPVGKFYGIISQTNPKELDQHKQLGTPISYTIIQRGTKDRAKATDVLELAVSPWDDEQKPRRFEIHGDPKDPGGLGHFLVYKVEERKDL